MDRAEKAEREKAPSSEEVLTAIAYEVADLGLAVDRLEVRQATPHEYTYRVYETTDDEYYGGVITFR